MLEDWVAAGAECFFGLVTIGIGVVFMTSPIPLLGAVFVAASAFPFWFAYDIGRDIMEKHHGAH